MENDWTDYLLDVELENLNNLTLTEYIQILVTEAYNEGFNDGLINDSGRD